MAAKFKIHPAVGIARLGDSPTKFYLAPETEGALPRELDSDGRETPVANFKDEEQRVKRQAAHFRIYVYDEGDTGGRELKIGEEVESVDPKSGQRYAGPVEKITWTVYPANKKSAWYEFKQMEGEAGYAADHPLRNAAIVGDVARGKLVIDPGPQSVSYGNPEDQMKEFKRGANPTQIQTFPPELKPNSIDTLGEARAIEYRSGKDTHHRLLVLGGFGNSGSYLQGIEHPQITEYANNDGWFDDIADGPVTATITIKITTANGSKEGVNVGKPFTFAVDAPAWVVVGYPRYAPQLVDMITVEDVAYDLALRKFAADTAIYGEAPFDGTKEKPSDPEELVLWQNQSQYNQDYYPWFWRDIWPILRRPDDFKWVYGFFQFVGADPHRKAPGGGGNLDPEVLSIPPHEGEDPDLRRMRARKREFVYGILRKEGEENDFKATPNPAQPAYNPKLMPLMAGDNPISNTLVSKFLRLTDTQLFFLRQWAAGKFINECREQLVPCKDGRPIPPDRPLTGEELDRGSLASAMGGSFCPGAEVTWIIRNPAIYSEPYRLKHSSSEPVSGSLSLTTDLAAGLEPGDLTKYCAVPWQSDFNECSHQPVNITYRDWNKTYPSSIGDPAVQTVETIPWWPSHRPLFAYPKNSSDGKSGPWTYGIPGTEAGDLLMVTAWKDLGFFTKVESSDGSTSFLEIERNNKALGDRP